MAKEQLDVTTAEAATEVEDLSEQLDCLVAMSRLDLEAAAAYEVAAEAVDDPKLARMLTSFAQDHRRHVELLSERLAEHGVKAARVPDAKQSVLVALALAAGAIDDEAVVEAMIANEQLTNGTYDTAAWVVSEPQLRAVVDKGRLDERKHLAALVSYMKELAAGGGAAARE